MRDRSGWIDILFKRRHPGSALSSGFLLDEELGLIARESTARRGGAEELRRASLEELGSPSAETRAMALLCLAVTGDAGDLKAADALSQDASELVQKALRVARFKLRG